jgi:ketosteroid isomerase-like protein
MTLRPSDPRLAQAFLLLREVLDGGAPTGVSEASAADPLAPPGPDLLASDFQELWQPDGPPASSYRHWQPPSDFHAGEGLSAFQQPFWTSSGRPDGHLRAEDALAVADCLYDFIHALERFDVEAAMACVADDFHELRAGRELDRQGFRHWLENLLDRLRKREIDVSLAEMPRPVAYGRLVLCETTIQVDPAAAPPQAVPSSLVLRLLLAFERDARGSWRILSCGHLDDSRDPE